MAEVRELFSNAVLSDGAPVHHYNQYGLFATKAYSEGDVIFTESPLVVLSSTSSASFSAADNKSLRLQFTPSSFRTPTGTAKDDNDSISTSSIINELVLPSSGKEDGGNNINTTSPRMETNIRGMVLALASYAIIQSQISHEDMSKLLGLYHPSLVATPATNSSNGDSSNNNQCTELNIDAMKQAKLAIQYARIMAVTGSKLESLLLSQTQQHKNVSGVDNNNDYVDNDCETLIKILLIYSCNAFEGGRLYHTLSRCNHSCNPNAVVVEGSGDGASSNEEKGANMKCSNNDVSILKAACDIAPGEEITISYLGKYLFASYPIRQRLLQANKHFVCCCDRCAGGGDLASRVPCPICHPRTGRYLEEDVMFDDDDEAGGSNDDDNNGLRVNYAIPSNGITAEERSLYCPGCKKTSTIDGGGSMRKKKEGLSIKYMCMAEDKVFDRLNNGNYNSKQVTNGIIRVADVGGGDDTETQQEIDQQFLQLSTSVCGAKHWSNHFMNLSLIEDSLATFHSTLLTLGQQQELDSNKDADIEELFVEIAEVADGIKRAYKFASSLNLKLDPSHWLFDYTVGLARTLVGLGDVKSQKYASNWITKVEKYANQFENDRMIKVVIALRDAWTRNESNIHDDKESCPNEQCESEEINNEDAKRRKIG
jgi:hypothetical protein